RYRSVASAGSTPHLLSSHYRCGHYSPDQLLHRYAFVPGIETRAGARTGKTASSRGPDTATGRSTSRATTGVSRSFRRPISFATPPANRAGMSQITRCTDDFPCKCDKGVGCEHDPTRVKPGHSQSLAGGVRDCELAQGQMGRGRFAHGWNNDFEFIARLR